MIYAIIVELKDARLQFDVEILLICYSVKAYNFEDIKDCKKYFNPCRKTISDFIDKLALAGPFKEHYLRCLTWLNAIEKEILFYEVARNGIECLIK